MKNSTILSICLIALVSIIGLSCVKNSEEVKFTEVEYGILGLDEYFNSLAYTDASENRVVVDDRAQFTNGSKKLSVSAKPFTAKMEVWFNNTTGGTRSYTIGIQINGEPKALKTVVCPPFQIAFGVVEYTIQ